MNVVTANENKSIIDRLDIDIIKRIDGEFELRELLSKFVNLYFNKMIIDITSIKDYRNMETINALAKAVEPSRVILLLNDDATVNSAAYMSNLVSQGFYNFTRNFEGIKFLYNHPNTYDNVKYLVLSEADMAKAQSKMQEEEVVEEPRKGRTIIGLANLTLHAGATSLTNMMVRQLNDKGINAIGIEMFRQDLIFYHDERLSSCMNKNDLERKLKESPNAEVVIIDLNEFGEADRFCDDVLYLVEPSYVKVTRLLKKNKNAFLERKGDKIVLNMSFVNDDEVADFEYETKSKVYFNLPPLNDRNKNLDEINALLRKLGFKN